MECIVANVENFRFDIEVALDEQFGALPLPFSGMDSKLLSKTNIKPYSKYLFCIYQNL